MAAQTEKVSVSLDVGALALARRAAAIETLTLSAYLTRLVQRHAWESERPTLSPDMQDAADAHTAELDEQDAAGWAGGGRAAG